MTKNSNAGMAIRGADVICTNPTHLFGLKRLEYEQAPSKQENFKTSGSFLRALSQKNRCPQIFENCLKITTHRDHIQNLTPPPSTGKRGEKTKN